jgi:hypothetical protein
MPITNVFGDGITYTEYPVQQTIQNVLQAYQRIVVDGNAISLDQADDSPNDTHIHLKGNLLSHQAFIKADNAYGTTLFRVAHNGKVFATGIDAPEITTLNATTATNTSDISTHRDEYLGYAYSLKSNQNGLIAVLGNALAATEDAVQNSLVKRGATTTTFTNLTANIMNIGNSIALYGDSNVQWIPQETINGVLQNVPGAVTRVGRDPDQGGGEKGDGIEILGRIIPTGGERNQILLQTNDETPNIELVANKSIDVPFIRCRDHRDETCTEITELGISKQIVEDHSLHITPGAGSIVIPDIEDGCSRYLLFLETSWNNESDEVILTGANTNSDETMRMISADVYINESQIPSNYTNSVVYISRMSKNCRMNSNIFRIVLKCELLNSETEIPAGTTLTLNVNNEILL